MLPSPARAASRLWLSDNSFWGKLLRQPPVAGTSFSAPNLLPMSRCLHHNDLGCIAQCPGRCCLHLYFGNVGLRLFPHELRQWHATVADLCVTHAPHVADPACRCLSLPGPTADQVYLFSLEELFLLQDLLTSAGLLLEVDSILLRPDCR